MITGRRVLCAASFPNLGHAIPTAALALEFQRAGNEVVIVTDGGVPAPLYERLGLTCTDLSTQSVSARPALAMMLALLRDFDPEITIADGRRDLWLAQSVLPPRCRISILRNENFLGYDRTSPYLPDKDRRISPEELDFLRCFNRPPVTDARLLSRTEVIVLPSTPEIEPVPSSVRRQYPGSEFVHTGCLSVDGFDAVPAGLTEWSARQRHAGRPVALLTTGTAWGTRFCRELLASAARLRFSCILAIPRLPQPLPVDQHAHPHVFIAEGIGLGDLLPASDVAVHHCGQGTMVAVILAAKPSVTIPSYHWDREDNALRLEELGCGVHLDDRLYRRGLNVEYLNEAIERVCSDQAMHSAAARLSGHLAEFTAAHGPAAVVRTLQERRLVAERPRRHRRAVRAAYAPSGYASARIRLQGARSRLMDRLGLPAAPTRT